MAAPVAFKDWGTLFKAADSDKDGVLDFRQLQTVLGEYGLKASDLELKELFHKGDQDLSDIRVSRVEFTKAMNEQSDNFHVCIMVRKASEGRKHLSHDKLEAIIQDLDAVMVPEAEVTQLRKCLAKYPEGASVESFLDSYLQTKK